MTIQNAAVLVEFGVSQWNAKLVDKKIASKIAREYRAGDSAGTYHKSLLAGTTFHGQIARYAQAMRNYHSKNTLPWQDRGARLLPIAMLQEYKAYMTGMTAQLESMIEEFTNDPSSRNFYLNQKEVAKQATVALGEMYNEADYPTLEEVRNDYAIRMSFLPLPTSGHFIVDAATPELEQLKAQYEELANKRVQGANESLWNRLLQRFEMAEQKIKSMDEYYTAKANGETGMGRVILQDDYLNEMRDLCHLLGKLNITGDDKLERARKSLLDAFDGLDGEDLKEDAGARQDVAEKLESIRKDFW